MELLHDMIGRERLWAVERFNLCIVKYASVVHFEFKVFSGGFCGPRYTCRVAINAVGRVFCICLFDSFKLEITRATMLTNISRRTPCLKKAVQNCFCQNFVKFPPILIIFGRKMAKRLKLCEVHLA